jgi:O-antigen ligase
VERLTFNLSRSRTAPLVSGGGRRQRAHGLRRSVRERAKSTVAAARERYDAAYLWMVAFTLLLFFRPQDQIPGLAVLHLSELTAIAGLVAMASRRLGNGQTITRMTPEVVGVTALGGIILATIPFSTWPGGSAHVFSGIYVKIILIFALMTSTITTPKRIHQMTWIMLVASGYIAFRAIFDYVRGVNLVEGDRIRGSIGGMFENPNDLALNLVTFIAPALFIMLQDRKVSRRLFAAGLATLMLGAIVCTKSRSGFLGLIAMALVVGYYCARLNPAAVFAILFAGLAALPAAPSSFWNRMDSIMNAEEDPTGSRAARLRLLEQGLEVFLANPITGVGAGQFQNYDNYDTPGGTIERWRVTHDVWLQVGAELGIFGLAAFTYLVIRAFSACFAVNRLLRQPRRKRAVTVLTLSDSERTMLSVNATGMLAAMVGWTVCAFFASVAFNWTFYYVLALTAAGRDIARSRRTTAVAATQPESPVQVSQLTRAHA